jgi:hypothetical protein
MGIEERFNISLVGALALREKQIQLDYRPIIAVHKWFARRFGTLFRGWSWPISAISRWRRPISARTTYPAGSWPTLSWAAAHR